MLKIETLNQNHNRSKFDCGVDELNHYLKNIARQHVNKGMSRTFVLIDIDTDDDDDKDKDKDKDTVKVNDKPPDNPPIKAADKLSEILGFFTLAFCEIRVEKLPRAYAKKYPTSAPAAKLARLAVARERQRQGLGTLMMVNAIERVISVSENLGIMGFFVDAKNEDAKAYYGQFGFIPLPDNPLELFLPLSTLRHAYETFSRT